MKEIIKTIQQAVDAAETKYEVEKMAKNKAYCFIIRNGLLFDFIEFSKSYRSENPHRDSIEYLVSQST